MRSALLELWGKQRIYPIRSQTAKVESFKAVLKTIVFGTEQYWRFLGSSEPGEGHLHLAEEIGVASAFLVRSARATMSVSVPTRPKNITIEISILPKALRSGVTFRESPTVPNAEVTSKRSGNSDSLSEIMSAIEAPVTGRTPGRYWTLLRESGANLRAGRTS